MRRYALTAARGLALFGLSLVGLVQLVVTMAVSCLGVVDLFQPERWLANLCRRLAWDWAGVSVPPPYLPRPGPPEPEPDGWYRDGDQLYRRPGVLRLKRRYEWLMSDPATHRDHLWLLLSPFVLAPTALAALAGVPSALGPYWRFSAALLGPSGRTGQHPAWRWLTTRLLALSRVFATVGLALWGLLFAAVHVLVTVSGFTEPTPPVIRATRALLTMGRARIAKWSGVSIPDPYLPPPLPPQRRADGMYQFGSRLFTSPTQAARWQYLIAGLRDPATWRDLAYLVLDPVVAVGLCLVPVAAMTASVLFLWPAVPLVAFVLVIAPYLLRVHGLWSGLLLAPTKSALLAQRVRRLAETRADATDAQAAELRRIERDLHDGAQARWVAMGLHLGAVERLIDQDPETAKQVLAAARKSSAEALVELRELVRGIHPPVLAERGLGDAIRAMALDSALDVRVTVDLPGKAPDPVEAAVYFAIRELLTNAAKHARADRVDVELRHVDGRLFVGVTDNGRGGASFDHGTGLAGLRRRLATFDGDLALHSPPGGPTTVTMEIPCALSSPRTSTSSETA